MSPRSRGSERRRLDTLMVSRHIVESRTTAQEAITAGRVTVDGAPALKPARLVRADAAIAIAGAEPRYVSRGGEKLAAALKHFGVSVAGKRCLDCGASTGGFTDCLLQHDAVHVTAVDVGYGEIHHRLREDHRVAVIERTNVRYIELGDLPGPPPTVVVADLSFISLRLVLPALRRVADERARAILLVKPQFEAGRGDVPRGGVVRDPAVWARSLRAVVQSAGDEDWYLQGVLPSPIRGRSGNVEFLCDFTPEAATFEPTEDGMDLVDRVVALASDSIAVAS